MGYVNRELKIPEDEPWIALVEIKPDGETDIVGYMDRIKLQELAHACGNLFYTWNNYINS